MKKKILGLLIALGLSVPAFASITVTPTRIEINANKVRNNYASASIEVRGVPDKPVRYRATTGYFEIKNSEIELMDGKGNPHNISSKIRFVPSEFTVPPGKSQRVRVNIANVKSLPDGESRAIIFLEDIEPKEQNIPNELGITTKLIIKTRVGVPIYVDKGNFVKSAEVQTFDIEQRKDGLYAVANITSKGNSKVRFTSAIQIINNKKLVDECRFVSSVVPHSETIKFEQKLDLKEKLKAGDYTARLIMTYDDEKSNKKNIKKDTVIQIKGEI